jgi:hypothetical protein
MSSGVAVYEAKDNDKRFYNQMILTILQRKLKRLNKKIL